MCCAARARTRRCSRTPSRYHRRSATEGIRARRHGRASNPVGGVRRSQVGSTPAAFRQFFVARWRSSAHADQCFLLRVCAPGLCSGCVLRVSAPGLCSGCLTRPDNRPAVFVLVCVGVVLLPPAASRGPRCGPPMAVRSLRSGLPRAHPRPPSAPFGFRRAPSKRPATRTPRHHVLGRRVIGSRCTLLQLRSMRVTTPLTLCEVQSSSPRCQ